MWSETLLIKPRLEPGGAKQMERSLSSRFANVSKRFGLTFKNLMKGAFLGVSLGILNKLLNPIEALEERMKKLLSQGTELRDLADRFGTDPASLVALQSSAQSLGVEPEQFREILTKYADALQTARKELKDPFKDRSDSTQAVSQFAGDKDLAASFTQFLIGLRALDADKRAEVESAVFGAEQFGSARRLIEADLFNQASSLTLPNPSTTNAAIEKAASLQGISSKMAAERDASLLVSGLSQLNPGMVQSMENAQTRRDRTEINRFSDYENLRRAADGIDVLKANLEKLVSFVAQGIGYLGKLVEFMTSIKGSRAFRLGNMFSGKGEEK